jgi:hypothetical protein
MKQKQMKQNLDTLRDEIQEYLSANGFLVFHSYSRVLESGHVISWNARLFPDFRQFLGIARKLDITLVSFYQEQLAAQLIEQALDDLQSADLMDRDEKRGLERRLREYRMYEGFTCAVELAFDHDGRMYLFTLRTDWYDEITDILDEVDAATPDPEPSSDDDQDSMGGFYSRN